MADPQRQAADRGEIVELAWRYGVAIDTFDEATFVDLFASDGRFSYSPDEPAYVGRAEIQRYLDEAPKWRIDAIRTPVHTTTVVDFDAHDENLARGRTTGVSYWSFPAGYVEVRGLHYDDVFVRTPDGWRFAMRSHFVDWQYRVQNQEQ